jgi:hypothetical protein
LTFSGCYSSGQFFDTLIDGLTQSQIASINTSQTWLTGNNNYLFKLESGMTIENCISICLQFKKVYAGLGGRLVISVNFN